MDAKVWSRVAGAAAILGGALAVILEIIFALPFFSGAGQTSEVAHFTTWSLNSGGMSAQYVLVPVLFFFVALVLAVRLWRRASRLVALGLALVFVGTLVRVLASLGPALYLPYIPLNALFNMTDGTATPLATFLANLPTYGQILLIPGLALLGIVLLRARLLLWGNWLLLSVGVLLLLYVIALTVGSSFIPSFYTWNVVLLVLSVLEGLAWVALGVSLWRSASRPAPVRVASAR